ncbi:MAG: DUF4149 domain-containing protein [Blastocatellia bacterium]
MAVNVAKSETAEPALKATFGVGQQAIAFIEALLLAVWLGSMIFFSFAVAPSAFAVLPSRELAGAVVTSAIGKLEILGLIIGPLLVLIQLTAWRARSVSAQIKALRVILLLMMTAAAALSRFWVSAKMVSLRQAMGGVIDDVAVTDPLRIEFNALHGYSVGLMSAAMLAGFVVLFFTIRSWLKR